MQDKEQKSVVNIRSIGSFLVCESPRLRLLFSPEGRKGLMGMLKAQNLETQRIYMERFNLGTRRQKQGFIKEASQKIAFSYEEIESLLDRFIFQLTEPEKEEKEPKQIILSDKDRALGETFLKNKNMFEELLKDFKTLGCVGEESNLLTCYLVATSRHLKKPLSAIITSQAGSGKSFVIDTVMRLMPDHQKEEFERLTPAVLYYMDKERLKNKVVNVEEEKGAEGASYSIRCLISKGRIKLAVTARDPKSGELMAQERHCEGPVAFLSTTTTPQMDQETWLRVLRLATNETAEQTRAITDQQWDEDTVEGARQELLIDRIQKKHHAAQSLLQPIRVLNPYTNQIKQMKLHQDLLRWRRENKKYKTLIQTIAFLRQHQKELRSIELVPGEPPEQCIFVDIDDIELANRLAREIFPKTLDELTPSARNLLIACCEMVRGECARQGVDVKDYRFTRRQLRGYTKWSDFQIGYYIKELESLEYLKAHHGKQGAQYVYELWFSGDPERIENPAKLIDVDKLREQVENNGNGAGLIEKFTRFIHPKPPSYPQLLDEKEVLLEVN